MPISPSSERNHTAVGGRHAVSPLTASQVVAAPDSLIDELERLSRADDLALRNVPDQFTSEGFTDRDLVLAERVKSISFSHMGMVRTALTRDPAIKPGYPNIAERLQSYLFVLECKPENISPYLEDIRGPGGMGVQALAQLRLNELLLRHPVLLHPRVRVQIGPRRSEKSGSCSVVHAIALSERGHFPMPGDWPAGEAPLERLATLANSDAFLQALSLNSIRHAGESVAARRRTPFMAAVKCRDDLSGLLVSLHQLGLLATTRRGDLAGEALENLKALGGFVFDWGQLYKADDSVWRDGEETKAFYNACGVLTPARPTIEVATRYWNPDYFTYIAARDDIARRNLSMQMRTKLFEAIFSTSMAQHTQEQVHYNVDAVIAGLVRATIAPDEQTAALWVKAQLRDVGTPTVGVPAALGFLEVLYRHGHRVTPVDFSVYHQNGADGFADLAPGWAQAMHIFDTTRTMEEVLTKSAPAPDPTVVPPPTGRRGARAGI